MSTILINLKLLVLKLQTINFFVANHHLYNYRVSSGDADCLLRAGKAHL